MSPHISTREYIRWLPDPASEPTSTVVLSSAASHFVDIRISKAGSDKERKDDESGILHSDRIDWAFAGTSASEIREDPDGKQIAHSTWYHFVDSRFPEPENATDEGDMYPQADAQTLEKGAMVNPETGRMTEYEELWNDVQIVPTTNEEFENDVSMVLQLHDDDNKARGMVVRVGQYCQGVMRVGDVISLERWQWDTEDGWQRLIRIGDGFVPCGVLLEDQNLEMGGEVKYGDYVWKVLELSDDC